MIKQTAGRDQLGEFAPKFAQLNDDVLFGEVWNREALSPKLRSILTVTVLVSKGLVDSSFQYHMMSAKQNGVTKNEMAEILTHVAFPSGSGGLQGGRGNRRRAVRHRRTQRRLCPVFHWQVLSETADQPEGDHVHGQCDL